MLATMTKAAGRRAAAADTRAAIQDLVRGFSIEVTPRQAEKVASFKSVLPQGTRVFVAFVPGESPLAIAETAARIARDGLIPVPHMPARSIEGPRAFEAYAGRLRAVGVTEGLVIAGGLSKPVGRLTTSMELLESGVLQDLGFEHLFVAGHPEGSPDISAPELARALAFKNAWSEANGIPLSIATQFGFDAARILGWAEAIGAVGNRLPIRIGVAGPASITSLLKYAKMCGVNASMTVMAKAGGRLMQLMGQSAPDGIITALATKREDHAQRIQNLHFYPFGGFEKTANWARAAAEGRFVLDSDGEGFSV